MNWDRHRFFPCLSIDMMTASDTLTGPTFIFKLLTNLLAIQKENLHQFKDVGDMIER